MSDYYGMKKLYKAEIGEAEFTEVPVFSEDYFKFMNWLKEDYFQAEEEGWSVESVGSAYVEEGYYYALADDEKDALGLLEFHYSYEMGDD